MFLEISLKNQTLPLENQFKAEKNYQLRSKMCFLNFFTFSFYVKVFAWVNTPGPPYIHAKVQMHTQKKIFHIY